MTDNGFCSFDPMIFEGSPIGMFHCPVCGQMVLAGVPHPPPEDDFEDDFSAREIEEMYLSDIGK